MEGVTDVSPMEGVEDASPMEGVEKMPKERPDDALDGGVETRPVEAQSNAALELPQPMEEAPAQVSLNREEQEGCIAGRMMRRRTRPHAAL
jgi:hypothetical protein